MSSMRNSWFMICTMFPGSRSSGTIRRPVFWLRCTVFSRKRPPTWPELRCGGSCTDIWSSHRQYVKTKRRFTSSSRGFANIAVKPSFFLSLYMSLWKSRRGTFGTRLSTEAMESSQDP